MNARDMLTSFADSFRQLPAVLWVLVFACAPVDAAPRVVASIKPLQFIAAAITEGISEPGLILGGGQDPHEMALRPSERRAIAEADILLWIGPALELPLADLAASHGGTVLTIQALPEVTLIDTPGGPDPHLWLHPQQALLIARSLQAALSAMDVENSGLYSNNLTAFALQLEAVDTKIRNDLARVQDQRWAVEHHAFRYFAAAYDLPDPYVLQESDNREPGLRSVAAFRSRLQDAGLACMLAEPGDNPAELRTMLGQKELAVRIADPLGQDLPVSANAFTNLLAQLAGAVLFCMGSPDE